MPLPPCLRAALAAGLLLAASTAAGAETFPFSLRPERARYLLGEPVYLRMEGARALPPALEESATALAIRDPGGAERVYRPPFRYRARPAAAGEGRIRYARLIAQSGGWVFPAPGRYVLELRGRPSARIGAAGKSASQDAGRLSDTVSIEIAAPSDSADKRAFALISRAPGQYAMAVYLEGGDHLAAGMGILRELASFPNGYARVAAFVLCSDWSQDFFARGSGSPRRADLARALAWARWDKSGGAYPALRSAFRIRNAVAARESRAPADPALPIARARLGAFEDSLTAVERALLASF